MGSGDGKENEWKRTGGTFRRGEQSKGRGWGRMGRTRRMMKGENEECVNAGKNGGRKKRVKIK